MVSAEHLADAYEAVAKANHYLVGISFGVDVSLDEYDRAEQILIDRQNCEERDRKRHKRLDLALDILASDRAKAARR